MNIKVGGNIHLYLGCFFALAGFFFLTMSLCAQEASPTDEIVIKSTNAVMFQITANIKLTQDQMSAIQSIITDYIVKVRDLQLSLQQGDIDSKTMYTQRQQLMNDENQAFSHILSPEQMKVWLNIQNE